METKVVNCEQKEMIPLTDNENKYYVEQKEWYICKREFDDNNNEKRKFKLCKKLEIIVILQENLKELLIAFVF